MAGNFSDYIDYTGVKTYESQYKDVFLTLAQEWRKNSTYKLYGAISKYICGGYVIGDINKSSIQDGCGGYNYTPSSLYQYDYGTLYPNTKILTNPIAMYVEIAKVSTLPTSGYYYQASSNKTLNPSYAAYPYFENVAQVGSNFVTANADKYYVKNIKFYNNANDGNIDTTNKRTLLGDWITYCLFLRIYYTSIDNVDNGDGDALFPILHNLFKSAPVGDIYRYTAKAYKPEMVAKLENCGMFYHSPSSSYGGKYTAEMSASAYDSFYCIYTKSQLLKYLNYLRVPFSFTESDILNVNSDAFTDYIPIGQPVDSTGGGTGTGDNFSDDVIQTPPNITTISAFNGNYAMTLSQLNEFSDYLWNSTFINDVKLLFNNPAEGVVSCKMFPFSFSVHDNTHLSSSTFVKVGNVTTTASGRKLTNDYNCIFEMGSVKIDEYYGSAMDYEPYTTIQIYLPYIGVKDISTNDVMNKTINVKYVIDIISGACISEIWVDTKLLYTFDGKIGVDIPINSTNAAQISGNLLKTGVGAVTGLVASGGNPLVMAGTALSTAKSVSNNQFHINKGNVGSAMAGFYLPQNPYLIINKPLQSLASSFGATHGFPCNVTKTLSALTGYTECETPVLNGISATAEEQQQIKNLLETGVIIQ